MWPSNSSLSAAGSREKSGTFLWRIARHSGGNVDARRRSRRRRLKIESMSRYLAAGSARSCSLLFRMRALAELYQVRRRNSSDNLGYGVEREIVGLPEVNARLSHVELLSRFLETLLEGREMCGTHVGAHQVQRAVILLRRQAGDAERLAIVCVRVILHRDVPCDHSPAHPLRVPHRKIFLDDAPHAGDRLSSIFGKLFQVFAHCSRVAGSHYSSSPGLVPHLISGPSHESTDLHMDGLRFPDLLWFRRVVPRIINRSIHVDLHSYDPRRRRSRRCHCAFILSRRCRIPRWPDFFQYRIGEPANRSDWDSCSTAPDRENTGLEPGTDSGSRGELVDHHGERDFERRLIDQRCQWPGACELHGLEHSGNCSCSRECRYGPESDFHTYGCDQRHHFAVASPGAVEHRRPVEND